MQGYPEEGGATEAPDAGASSGDFPAAIKSHFSPVGQHSGGAEGAASAPREARDPRADGVYGALDLGTNNCRLLLARPSRRGFRVVDAFSRIIRLGEGVSQTGRLSEPAMARTLDALKVCATKLGRAKVRRSRLVATEACRIAENGGEFLARVRDKLLPVYDAIPTGFIAATMMRQALDRATRALAEGDVIQCIRSYEELKGFEL